MTLHNIINVAFHMGFNVATGLQNIDPIVMRDDSFLCFNVNLHTERIDKGTRVGLIKASEDKVINLATYNYCIAVVLAMI
jgi:hypothetical protein